MRAREFIQESKTGKISKRHQQSTRGLHKVTDGDRWSADYKLYRLGLAAASTDGKTEPDIDKESWVGRWKITLPYSKADQEKLIQAYKAIDMDYIDVNNGDLSSQELESTNTISPVSTWNNKK
jgi:hypothetical protein